MTTQHLHRIQAAHACLPHLRLGQLIINAMGAQPLGSRRDPADTERKMFYATDDDLVKAVELYAFNRDQL